MEKDRLKFSINRYDHYYDSVNNKSNIILGISTFIVSALVAFFSTLPESMTITVTISILFYICIALGLIAMLIMIIASTPFLSNDEGSTINFLSVANTKLSVYTEKSETMTEEGELKDLRYQSFQLAKGLSKKFKRLRIACILISVQFLLFIPLIILITNNIK